jgi:Gpi18-like mannosyltransferase
MTSLENKFIDAINKHRNVLLLVLLFVLGAAIRWAGRYFVSEDMTYCLMPWFEKIKAAGGLPALSNQVGDYGILYQTLISIMTYLPIQSVVQYKLLSSLFDIPLALVAAAIYRDVCLSDKVVTPETRSRVHMQSWLVAAVVWLLPTVMLNSSYWGQCDSLYATCCLATLYLLRRNSFAGAFVMLGLAFACKLQTVFILPIIGVYYLVQKRFSLIWILLSVAVVWLSGIVAFAYGRNLLAPILIYTGQVGHYQEMYMSFPSLWMLVGNDYWSMRWFAILITVAVLAVGLWYCLNHKHNILSNERFYAVAAWFMWSMLLFLPSMHDRYAYLLDLLLVLLACWDRRFAKYAVITVLISLYYYGIYLFGDRGDGHVMAAVIYLVTYLHYTWTLVRQVESDAAQ